MSLARSPGAGGDRDATPPAAPHDDSRVAPRDGVARSGLPPIRTQVRNPARRPVRQQVRQPVRTLAVVGAKGGVGRSTVAANLAFALGCAGREVLLFDADLVSGDAARLLGATPRAADEPGAELVDVVAGRAALDELVLEGPRGTSAIASSGGDLRLSALSVLDHASLVALFSHLDTDADTLVVDTPSGLSDAALCHAGAAREALVVTGADPGARDQALAAMRALHERYRMHRFRIVANGVRDAAHGLELYAELADRLPPDEDLLLDYAGAIPHDPLLSEATARGRPVAEVYPRAPSALAFAKLAARAARWPRPATPAGHIEFFVERLVHAAGPHLVRATTA